MELSSKTVENISFDAVKTGLVDALQVLTSSVDKITLLESDQKNIFQGMGERHHLKSLKDLIFCLVWFRKVLMKIYLKRKTQEFWSSRNKIEIWKNKFGPKLLLTCKLNWEC